MQQQQPFDSHFTTMEALQLRLNDITAKWTSCACDKSNHDASQSSTSHIGRPIHGPAGNVVAHAVDIPPEQPEFVECTAQFEGTGLRPVVCARIQNLKLARRYAMQAVELGESRGEDKINEALDQFHCTSCPDIDDIYRDGKKLPFRFEFSSTNYCSCDKRSRPPCAGLDQRLAKEGFFGRGIYTTSSPGKANRLATCSDKRCLTWRDDFFSAPAVVWCM